jgi:hypothetical protein
MTFLISALLIFAGAVIGFLIWLLYVTPSDPANNHR